jgi:hypothetical protein
VVHCVREVQGFGVGIFDELWKQVRKVGHDEEKLAGIEIIVRVVLFRGEADFVWAQRKIHEVVVCEGVEEFEVEFDLRGLV